MSGDFAGFRLTLVRLTPDPVSTRRIEQRDYVAWVKVTIGSP
jgi:hypothetical protein